MPLFDAFYLDRDGFPSIKQRLGGVAAHPSARAMLEGLMDRGYEVVIATNPVFPPRGYRGEDALGRRAWTSVCFGYIVRDFSLLQA